MNVEVDLSNCAHNSFNLLEMEALNDPKKLPFVKTTFSVNSASINESA
jgi:hypothetical protein